MTTECQPNDLITIDHRMPVTQNLSAAGTTNDLLVMPFALSLSFECTKNSTPY